MPDPSSQNARSAAASPSGTGPADRPRASSTAQQDPASAGAAPAEAGPGLRSLNPLGLAAGGAAAATASVIGGQLGVAGTVIGAFLTSIVSATALAVYSESVKRGRRAVTRIKDHALSHGPAASTADSTGAAAGVGLPEGRGEEHPTNGPDGAPSADPGRRRRILKIVLGALAMAAIAVVLVFGIQRATGTELSHGTGTIQRSVGGGDVVAPAPTDGRSSAPVDDPSSSTSPEDDPSSSTPTDTPTSTTSTRPSSSGSTAPSRSSTPAPSSTTGGGRDGGTTAPAPTGGDDRATQGAAATPGTGD